MSFVRIPEVGDYNHARKEGPMLRLTTLYLGRVARRFGAYFFSLRAEWPNVGDVGAYVLGLWPRYLSGAAI